MTEVEAIESRASKEKVAVIFVVVLFVALCALTAGVDSHQAEYANTLSGLDIDSGSRSFCSIYHSKASHLLFILIN
jgi:hypothetical protein